MDFGRKKEIHTYYDKYIKTKYYEGERDFLNFEEFYQMSEQFFPYRGLPVIFRDVLY